MYSLLPYRTSNRVVTRNPFDDPFFRGIFTENSPAFRVDVQDKGDHFELDAELPGVAQDKIELYAQNDVLTIAAEMRSENKEEKNHYLYCERRSGHFQRSFDLEGIDEEKIAATYKDGILHVTLPKAQPAPEQGRRNIAING